VVTSGGRRAHRTRLDQLCLARGLAPSRHQAEAAIRAGEIFVDGQRVEKPGTLVDGSAAVERRPRGPAYVSRGGVKLAAALDAFDIRTEGVVAVDVGASTGGFTDCLLQRGARRVYAVDVGHGQLHWRLRQDPRVVVMEGRHGARLAPQDVPETPDIVTVDCSFISVLKVLPALARLIGSGGEVLALVKPQFEAGPKAAPKGVVRDPSVHEAVLRRVIEQAPALGLTPFGVVASPLLGPDGNREFFVRFRRNAPEQVATPADEAAGTFDADEAVRRAVWGAGGAAP
jgi:23S rRNA (cytidine1920-2'-O)/16S rRNA (cytidine1409-2'-O)-methyltransferase